MRFSNRLVHHASVTALDMGGLDAHTTVMKLLLATTDPTRIAFAQAILNGEGIECFEMDVHMSVLEGSIGILPRRLMVRDRDHARAARALEDNDIPSET